MLKKIQQTLMVVDAQNNRIQSENVKSMGKMIEMSKPEQTWTHCGVEVRTNKKILINKFGYEWIEAQNKRIQSEDVKLMANRNRNESNAGSVGAQTINKRFPINRYALHMRGNWSSMYNVHCTPTCK